MDADRKIASLIPKLIELRRDLHSFPELGFEEVRTSEIVATHLLDHGLEVHRGLAGTGVVGILRGRKSSNRAIGLRADMDALPLTEMNDFAHASTVSGRMHACGHDGHTTMLLGAAQFLAENPDFEGTIHFIFQPAEESLGGARVMLQDGLFDKFPCDAIYGMHNFPGLPVGSFGLRSGAMMAASDTWNVVFEGSGGHGGIGVHESTDPTEAAGHFLASLQTIVARNVPAAEPAVLSVGHIAAGSFEAPNVIPSRVTLRGTARSFQEAVRDILERRLSELGSSIASAFNCRAECHYQRRYPVLVNSEREFGVALTAAENCVGARNVTRQMPLFLGGEDFAYMLQERPGAYIFIGNGAADGASDHGLHSTKYDFNDDAIAFGITYWLNVVRQVLSGPNA